MNTDDAGATGFDDTLALPKQPPRTASDQAVVDGAADALRHALGAARAAKTSAELCKAFPALNKAMTRLLSIAAAKGIEQQVFSNQRSALLQLFDGAESWCASPENVGVDTLQELIADIRKQFVALVALGS